jgi:hypothetical protein
MDLNQIIKKVLSEATSDSGGSRGSYIAPMQLGIRKFKKSQNGPFTIPVSKYDSPMLEFDSYDGSMDETKKQIKKIESKAKKVTNYIKKHPESTFSDDDGNSINQTPGKNKKIVPVNEWVEITEASTSVTAGEYNGPIEIGLKKWSKSELGPFYEFIDNKLNDIAIKKSLKNNLKRIVGVWEKGKDGTHNVDTHDVHTINEDLGVWFGKKKKPKGSSQPKGPWVNICSKVDGKHPPCGRQDTSKGSYPKCRAAGVAGKMSDSQKRSACQQKRTAEKKDTQTGKGQKPIMTSYKTKKESVDSLVNNILIEIRNSV